MSAQYGDAVATSAPRRRRRQTPLNAHPLQGVVLSAYAAAGLPIRGWVALLAKRIESWLHLFRDWAVSYIKSQCSQLRRYAVCGGEVPVGNLFLARHFIHKVDRPAAFQLSLIARALPAATGRVCERTKQQFLENAALPSPSVEISNRFEALASELIDTWQDNPKEKPGLPGQSSSWGSTRKEGGQAAEFACTLTDDDLEYLRFGQSPSTVTRQTRQTGVNRAVKRFASDWVNQSNVMRPVAIAERGGKCRMVTCSNPRYVSAAHAERRRLWRLILSVPEISRYLGPAPGRIRVQGSGWIISTDMSKATDNISHEMLSWFCLRFNIEPRLVFEGFFLDGAAFHSYRRGCPMGMPCSWAILSLIHWMCMRESGIRFFAIRGDDAIARMSYKQFDHYQDSIRNTGMSLNLSKTYKSPDCGTFCERMYRLRGDVLYLLPHLGLRVFNPEDKAAVIRDLHQLVRDSGLPWSRILLAFQKGAGWLHTLARKYKLPKYLPLCYGGLGLPCPKGWKTNRWFTWKVRWLATHGYSFSSQLIISGKHLSNAAKALDQVKLSLSVKDPCNHLDRLSTEWLLPAQLLDIAEGTRTEVKLSPWTLCKRLKDRFNAAGIATGGSDYYYADLFDHEMKASRESVILALGHSSSSVEACLRGDGPAFRAPVYRTTWANF